MNTLKLILHCLVDGTWVVPRFWNKAGMNILVQVFLRSYVFVSLGQAPKSGITGLTNVYFSDLGCAVTH